MEKPRKIKLALFFVVSFFVLGTTNPGNTVPYKEEDSKVFSSDNLLISDFGEEPPSMPPIRVSIEDVTQIALENSLDIQIAQLDAYIGRTGFGKAESIFDTFFTAEASYSKDKTMSTTTILGTISKEHSFSAGIEKKIPTGTTISLDATATKNRSDSSFSSLNPYNEALAEISITQELGKNFFGIADRSGIKITKLDIENSDYTSLDDIEDALYEAQRSYWDLVLKVEELAIKKDMVAKSSELYTIYEDKLSLGISEEAEFLAIKALVLNRQSDVEIAKLNKETAKNDLLFLLNQGDFEQDILPKDSLTCALSEVNLYQALEEATESRRDYKRAKNDLKKNDIDIVIKKNALWPQIDLKASLIRNNLNSRRSKAWQDFTKMSNDEIFVKLSISLPLENREAKAGLSQAELEKQRYLLNFKRVERVILQEINNKVNYINTIYNHIKLFEATVDIHRRKLKIQIRRIGYGRSDADTLIRYQEDLLDARLALAKALYSYRTGFAELELLKNSLLGRYWGTLFES